MVKKGLIPLLLVFISVLSYQFGYVKGSQAIQAEIKNAYDAMAVQEVEHQKKQKEIADALAQVRTEHETTLASQRAVFDQRLLQSDRRAQVYQRQAQAGAAAQRDLASHAAQLDRALEEGRDLVRELGSTLGLRDHQLKLLGDQIRADRQLLEGTL
jgi:hypothetical protein